MGRSDAAERFAQRVEGLSQQDRARACVKLGQRAASGTRTAQGTVVALRASERPYLRSLGLLAAFGDRDGAAILAALEDPEPPLVRRALRMLRLVEDDEALVAALLRLPQARLLRRALRRLRARPAVVQALHARLPEEGSWRLQALHVPRSAPAPRRLSPRERVEALPELVESPRWFRRLTATQRAELVEDFVARPSRAGARVLRLFDPADPRREVAFTAWLRLATPPQVRWLAPLPPDLRTRAADALAPELPLHALPDVAPLLPFVDAQRWLEMELTHPEVERRAEAAGRLLGIAARDREAVPAALDYVAARAFEADPVRLAMAQALAAVPRRFLRLEDLDRVEQIVDAALAAADLSPGTTHALAAWLTRLTLLAPLRLSAKVDALCRAHAASVSLSQEPPWPHELPVLRERLTPYWRAAARRGDTGQVLELASWLGPHLRRLPKLQAWLVRPKAQWDYSWPYLALARLRPPGVHATLRAGLAADLSLLRLEPVARWAGRRATDLLTPALSLPRVEGARLVLSVETRGHGSWTEAQQRAFGQALAGSLQVKRHEVDERAPHLGRLCWAPEALAGWIDGGGSARNQAAVLGLKHLETPALDALLLSCMQDRRRSWALDALARRAHRRSPEQALALLLQVGGKGEDEALRLLVSAVGEGARPTLQALHEGRASRSWQIIALRGLARLELDAGSVANLQGAASHRDHGRARAALAAPPWRPAGLEPVLVAALDNPDARTRAAALRWLDRSTLDGPELRAALLRRLVAGEEEAAPLLRRRTDGSELPGALQALLAVPERWSALGEAAPEEGPLERALLDAALEDPLLGPAAAQLAGTLGPEPFLRTLEGLGEGLDVEALREAAAQLPRLATPELEGRLAASPKAAIRALAPLCLGRWARSERGGWDEAARARLAAYLRSEDAAQRWRAEEVRAWR